LAAPTELRIYGPGIRESILATRGNNVVCSWFAGDGRAD
jgi:hypothetical protein